MTERLFDGGVTRWRLSVKVGDLVTWDGGMDTWYKGKVGLVIDFGTMKNPWVLYSNGRTIRLAYQALEVISESR